MICLTTPTSFVEKLSGVLSGECNLLRNVAEELADVRQVILVPGVVFARVGLKQVVSGGHLESHAGDGPDVCGRVVPSA